MGCELRCHLEKVCDQGPALVHREGSPRESAAAPAYPPGRRRADGEQLQRIQVIPNLIRLRDVGHGQVTLQRGHLFSTVHEEREPTFSTLVCAGQQWESDPKSILKEKI